MQSIMEDTKNAIRPRKDNFSNNEILALIDAYGRRKDVPQGRFKSTLTNRDKKEAWDALTADVNAVSSSRRKPDELKKNGKSLPATLAQIWLNASTPARVGDRSREKALTQT